VNSSSRPVVSRPRPAKSRDRSLSNPKPIAVARRRSVYLRSVSTALLMFGASSTAVQSSPAPHEPRAPVERNEPRPADELRVVAALDTEFQRAVKTNDAATIDRILAPDMVLVTGRGSIFTKADHVERARKRLTTYQRQDEVPGTQKVRLYGPDTAVVTALLWIKGCEQAGKAFDYKVWFSDTYVRTPQGWRYAFGQSSLPLSKDGPM
jgi:uncharacterized protein (TIGR02246 family)